MSLSVDESLKKIKRIAFLIHGYIFKILSNSEQEELESWKKAAEENLHLFNEATNEKNLLQDLGFIDRVHEEEVNVKLAEVKSKLRFTTTVTSIPAAEPKEQKPVIWLRRSWAAAASLFFVIALSAAIIYRLASSTHTQDAVPGGARATLTLADGSHIDLENAKDGTLAADHGLTILKKDGQVQYTGTGDNQASHLSNTITTPRGGSYPVTLSDGSKIWLNASSTIKFPPVFPGNERRVVVSGEVYFEVAHQTTPAGSRVPFIVQIKDKNVQVEVLGTHFNINAYSDEPIIKTTLLEGAVKITSSGMTASLKPGQQAEISNRELKVVDLNESHTQAAKAWKDGNFDFRKSDIKSFLREVGRWYDVEVIYESEIPNHQYGAQITRNTKLSEVLNTLKLNGINSRIEGKKIIISSSPGK
jgi:transmembrane sensor